MPLAFLALTAIAAPHLSLQETTPPPPISRSVLVLDEATGRPIPGATVYAVKESRAPVWGEFWFTAAALTDDHGRAALPPAAGSDQGAWLMARAEGYGAAGRYGHGSPEDAEFRLKRETPITIEVVDFLGRPLPLAHLGVAFGCGHTPDLVSAVTGPDGRATLRGVANVPGEIADLYVVHPELSQLNYDSVPFGDAVEGVARFHGEPGCMITGRVLLPSGEPAVGHRVGGSETHRGNWASTDEHGEFRLYGCQPEVNHLIVVTPGVEQRTFFGGARPGAYRTLQLDGTPQPERLAGTVEGASPPTSVARVQINVPNPTGRDLPNRLRWVPVTIWEETTGRTFSSETGASGAVGFELPPGHYAVEVGGPASPYPATTAGRFTVGAMDSSIEDKPSITITCNLPAPRVCSLDVVGLLPGETVWLTTATGPYLRNNLEGPDVNVPSFLLPSGLWSAHTTREDKDGVTRYLPISVPRADFDAIVLRVPE